MHSIIFNELTAVIEDNWVNINCSKGFLIRRNFISFEIKLVLNFASYIILTLL